jgi:flagellar biosynthesis/type III secretory pathway M-ring protein FliF/YscJ
MDNFWLNALWSVTPTALLGVLFWLIIRSILRADRTEREAYARIEAEERAKRSLPADKPSAEKPAGS